MDVLRPGYDRVKERNLAPEEEPRALEKEAILVSLSNLMTFPFVKSAVESGELTLHGLWTDIGEGDLEFYNAKTDDFEPV
jgi:carbonic anhydrase